MNYPGEEMELAAKMQAWEAQKQAGPQMGRFSQQGSAPLNGPQPLLPALNETMLNLMQELSHISNRMDALRGQLGSNSLEDHEKTNPSPSNLQQVAQQCTQFARAIDFKLRELGV